jgi:hypothetical protein
MNNKVLPVSGGRNVRCESIRYGVSQSKQIGLVDSDPPFYLHVKYRNTQ